MIPLGPDIKFPDKFTDPFRYAPHPAVRHAADDLIRRISETEGLETAFSEGKMLGVLIVEQKGCGYGYIAAFSGNAGGKSRIEGFVPPIYDLMSPSGNFKIREAEISSINRRIDQLESSELLTSLKTKLSCIIESRDAGLESLRKQITASKTERDEIRKTTSDPRVLAELIKESQHKKADYKRAKASWESQIAEIQSEISTLQKELNDLKKLRSELSDKLQKWISDQYIVHNACGEQKSISEIFAIEGLSAPGGTGECAAPKLLEYAYRNDLRPVAMGEFWYGRSPHTAVRTHGHFYPSCTSKCGPLLRFMLKGLELENTSDTDLCPRTIFEDEHIIVIEKPSGMPSVPGLDGKRSVMDWLGEGFFTVHRLDMDTSGVIIFAKTADAAADLQKQFEGHSIRKTYIAKLSACKEGRILQTGDKGMIDLPLSPDYDERPRQKVDSTQGKPSITEYEVVRLNDDGTVVMKFHPFTGRTHQLRVHSAHILGLGRPIIGDMLYGGAPAGRLHLHAKSITFRHPQTLEILTFTSIADI